MTFSVQNLAEWLSKSKRGARQQEEWQNSSWLMALLSSFLFSRASKENLRKTLAQGVRSHSILTKGSPSSWNCALLCFFDFSGSDRSWPFLLSGWRCWVNAGLCYHWIRILFIAQPSRFETDVCWSQTLGSSNVKIGPINLMSCFPVEVLLDPHVRNCCLGEKAEESLGPWSYPFTSLNT